MAANNIICDAAAENLLSIWVTLCSDVNPLTRYKSRVRSENINLILVSVTILCNIIVYYPEDYTLISVNIKHSLIVYCFVSVSQLGRVL